MSTVEPKVPLIPLGTAGLHPDLWAYSITPPPEGFNFLSDKPRSSIAGADVITFEWVRDGHPTKKDIRLEDTDNNPILDSYIVHDYGFFKGRGNEDSDQVLLVPVAYVRDAKHELQTRGVVKVFLNADPAFRYREDMLPLDVVNAMALNPQASEMLDARDRFRFEEREKRSAAVQAAENKAIEAAADGTAAPAETAPDKATPAIENVQAPAQAAAEPVLKPTAIALTEVAADMSAQINGISHGEKMTAALEAYKAEPDNAHKQEGSTLLGAILPYAVKAGFISLYDLSELLETMLKGVDHTRRISAINVQEVRDDRWKIMLYCREAEGRTTTPHTVHLTAASWSMDYRVTGAKRYPHQLEILEYIKARFEQVLTQQIW